MKTFALVTTALLAATAGLAAASGDPVHAVVTTAPLINYDDAPGTPDADDPAIWVDPRHPNRSLVIGTAKDAGLLVYNLEGELLQAIRPPNAPQVLPIDPPTPAGVNLAANRPCVDSQSGETFGRYNNVDIAYGVRLGAHPHAPQVDVAVVSDRGCDRVRFFAIDPSRPGGPLFDVTAEDVPRVFPNRYEQPSPLQPSGAVEGWRDNPVDDQNTVYGLTVDQGSGARAFVSQRERGLVKELEIVANDRGRLTYREARTFLFRTHFTLVDERNVSYRWTPCREAALEEPQSEGLVFDHENDTLYVAFETIGLYKLPVKGKGRPFVEVEGDYLIEPLTSFGRAYRAIPDDDEFECEYGDDSGDPGDVVAVGSDINAGHYLAADLEGLSIVAARPGYTLMIASSQGDSSFHLFEFGRRSQTHLGSFLIDGVGDTDGVHYVPTPVTPAFPLGLLVVQNGEAPEPDDTSDINGYGFDGATQFKFVSFLDAVRALR